MFGMPPPPSFSDNAAAPGTVPSLFGKPASNPSQHAFDSSNPAPFGGGAFGSGKVFGKSVPTNPQSNLFSKPPPNPDQPLFGAASKPQAAFGKSPSQSDSKSLFGANIKPQPTFSTPENRPETRPQFKITPPPTFGNSESKPTLGSLFKPQPAFAKSESSTETASLFGAKTGTTSTVSKTASNPETASLFGAKTGTTSTFGKSESGSLFGSTSKPPSTFKKPETQPEAGSLFGGQTTSKPALFSKPGPKPDQALFGKEPTNKFTAKEDHGSKNTEALFGAKPDSKPALFGKPVGFDNKALKSDVKSRLGKRPEPPPAEVESQGEDDEIAEDEEDVDDVGEEEEEGEYGEEEEEDEEGGEDEGNLGDEDYDPDHDEGDEESEGSTADVSQIDTRSATGRHLERLTSKEELQSIKSIICEDVPPIFLRKPLLQKHFSKFGEIVKISVNEKARTATVHFTDHKSAKKAKSKGDFVSAQLPLIGQIFFTRTRKSSEFEEPQKPVVDSSVDDELRAMAGPPSSSSIFAPAKEPAAKKPQIVRRPASQLLLPKAVQKPTDKPEQDKPKINRREIMELLKRQATNDFEKFEILEARDRLIRDGMPPKQGDTTLVGSCPDICPEKERYSRSAKNQLRFYEKIEGAVHHKAVVKEYSRSSADQDVPLPHDLRPSPVLKLTMDHLLCNVISRIDNMRGTMIDHYEKVLDGKPLVADGNLLPGETVGDWFEYIWSTTRGIRKDITQQDLTDLIAVDMVEKCARFHIMCAERLVEEDSHNFDRKLNDENLTKCIQSLKHMYHDLALKRVQCQNEPEFRAYEVLMNMNDGDTLRRAQTLDQWVRLSPPMTFSLKLLAALSNNNYIKFFKLVREATLLQGCILLRYFHQVRTKALQTIVRAYCPGKNVIQFSLSKLTTMLGFEDLKSCSKYCRLHGLESEDDLLFLERSSFYHTEEIPALERARNLIESKRHVSWSEVINNGPLPQNPYLTYRPHSSFDDNGFLKPEAFDAGDQTMEGREFQVQAQKEEMARQLKMKQEENAASEIVNELVLETATELCQTLCSESERSVRVDEAVDELAKEIVQDAADEQTLAVGQEALRAAKNEELMKRLKEEEAKAVVTAGIEVGQEIIEETIEDMTREVCKNLRLLVDRELKMRETRMAMAPDIIDELIKAYVDEECLTVAQLALEETRRERQQKMDALRAKIERRTKLKVFNRWRHLAHKSKRHRETLANFPSTPSFHNLATQTQMFTLNGDYRKFDKGQFKTLVESSEVTEDFVEKLVLEKIDLKSAGANQKGFYASFKLVLCLPQVDSDSENAGLCAVLAQKFSGEKDARICSDVNEDTILNCQSLPLGHERFLQVCVRKLDSQNVLEDMNFSEKKRRDFLFGTSAILFVQVENSKPTFDKLMANLNCPVPVSVLTVDDVDLTTQSLDLKRLQSQGKISNFQVKQLTRDIFDLNTLLAMHQSFEWIADSWSSKKPDLKVESLDSLAKTFIENQFYKPVTLNQENRIKNGLNHQDPNLLVTLYNSTVDHLIRVIKNKELAKISWPIPEFKSKNLLPNYWNDENYIGSVIESLKMLYLPFFPGLSRLQTWTEAVESIKRYFEKIRRSYIQFTPVSEAKINRYLKASLNDLKARASARYNVDLDEVCPELIPWSDIVLTCAEYKLNGFQTKDRFDQEENEMIVGYRELEYCPPKEWLKRLGWTSSDVTSKSMLDKSITAVKDRSVLTPSNSDKKLKQLLNDEKRQSLEFENRLRAASSGQTLKRRQAEEKPDEDETDCEEQMEPAVSLLSPTIGSLLMNSNSPVILVQKSTPEKRRRVRIAQHLSGEQFDHDSPSYSHSKSRLIQTLKNQVHKDLDESISFDKKLHDAILNSN